MAKNITSVSWDLVGSDLPSGLSFDTATGTFSGTTSEIEDFILPVRVTTNYGYDIKDVTFEVKQGQYAPTITEGQKISFSNNGLGSSHTLEGTNVTLGENGITSVIWSISGLPSNTYGTDYTQSKYFDASTGTFIGTTGDLTDRFGYAMEAGTYTVPVTVTTNYGTTTENITLKISSSGEPT